MHRNYNREDRQNQNRQMRDGRRGDNPRNLGSARSDYGNLAYGGGLNRQGMERGWLDKTTDEISSWFGDEDAMRRRQIDERRGVSSNRNYAQQNYGDYSPNYFQDESSAAYSNMSEYDYEDWHNLRARDVMTTTVTTVHPNDSVQYAAHLMAECDCGAIPVVDWKGRILGMITDRDITVRVVANGLHSAYAQVASSMTNAAFACHMNDSIDSCMRLMAQHQIRRIPIVDEQNRVVGIISQGDLAQHACRHSGAGERRAVGNVVGSISEPTYGSHS